MSHQIIHTKYICGHTTTIEENKPQPKTTVWGKFKKAFSHPKTINVTSDWQCEDCRNLSIPASNESTPKPEPARKHAPPAKGMEETVALLAMNGSSKSVVSLKKVQRASQNSARTKMGTINEASEDRRIKEKLAKRELEKAVEFWEGIHGIHGPPDLAPSDCRECADIARTIGDSKIHPKITSTLDRFPRIPSPPRKPEILAPEAPQAMRDSLARPGNPDSTKPHRPPRPSRIPRPARLETIVERSSSSEDSRRATPATPTEPVQESSVFESDSEDEEDDNEELSTLSRTFPSRSTLDLTLLDEVRRDYLAQRPPSPTSPVAAPTTNEEAAIAPGSSEELAIPLLSPSSAEGQGVVANIREYFNLPHTIPFSGIPGRLDTLAGYLINDRTVVPRDWEQRFDIVMRAGEADIVNRRIVEDWIKSINWYEGRGESNEEAAPEEISAIPRPVTPRHLNPDLDTSGLRLTVDTSAQAADDEVSPIKEGDSPDLTDTTEISPLSDNDSDEESSIVLPPRLYNIMTRPQNSERGLAHRPARSSILRSEVVVFDSETVERVRKYKW
jgi:hypothetical protein